MSCAVLLILLAASLLAEEPAKFTIEGTVVNAITGEVLRRAAIALQGGGQQNGNFSTSADAGGHFLISDLPQGDYALSAEKQGYAHAAPTHVALGPSHGDITIKLIPLSRITGKVVDNSGDPILNANVQLFRSAIQNGRRVTLPASTGLTNDLGEYHVSSLPAGRYFVSVTAPPEPDGAAYPRTFYGGGTDMVSASPIELSPGGDAKADITLRPVRSFAVRGSISNLPPNMHPYLNIARKGAVMAANEGHATQIDAETGKFEFRGVTPGAWVITAGCFERGAQLFGSADVVVADSDSEGVTLTLARAAELSGIVRVDAGSGATVNPRGVYVGLRPASDGSQSAMGAQIQEDGAFVLEGVQPGDYLLNVRVQEPWFVKSALMGGTNVLAAPFIVTASGASGSFEITIAQGGGQIDGTIVDGITPVLNCAILLLGPGQERQSRPDPSGKFHFGSLAPGEYAAYAFPDLQDIEYTSPEVMQRFSGTRVSVTEGAKQQVELKLNRTVY